MFIYKNNRWMHTFCMYLCILCILVAISIIYRPVLFSFARHGRTINLRHQILKHSDSTRPFWVNTFRCIFNIYCICPTLPGITCRFHSVNTRCNTRLLYLQIDNVYQQIRKWTRVVTRLTFQFKLIYFRQLLYSTLNENWVK